MFVHHVFFWLNDPENEKKNAHFEEELEALIKISNISKAYLGKPAHTPREVVDNTYQYSLLLMFDNKEQHDIYQDHEAHHVFINNCKQYWTRVQIYDSVGY